MDFSQYAAKLVAFIHQHGDALGRKQTGQDDKLEPTASFYQFLQGDIDLVNEIRAALAGTGFFVIWRSRNSAADDLAGNMASHARLRQGVHDFGNAAGKLPQSIGEFLRRHTHVVYMTNDKFSMTNLHSLQSLKCRPNERIREEVQCANVNRIR